MSNQENQQVKRQIGVMGNKENTWKKYIYLENGVLVGEHLFKIENGIEIPWEGIGINTHSMTLPANFEIGEQVKIENLETGAVNLVNIKEQQRNVEFVKIYNETRNIGIVNRLENGIQVACQYYTIENNQEMPCATPQEEPSFFVPLPCGSSDFSSHEGELSMYDSSGNTFKTIPKANIVQINNENEIKIKEQNRELSNAIITKINELSSEEKEKLIENLHKTNEPVTTLEGKQMFTSTLDQVAETIGNLINEIEEIPADFYKTIDTKEEFGISRVVADKIYNLPKLLQNANLIRQGETTTYIIQAEVKDSYANSIRLEHRLQATSPEEAKKIATLVLKRLKGVQLKIWVACWKMANTKARPTFTCRLTDLMKCSNPLRSAHFNSAEKLEFYEHLRSLENTKFVYTKFYKIKGKEKIESYEIRLLEIHRRSGDKNEETPQELTMTVLNVPALQKQKTTFVGVGVKNKTLELHADDAMMSNVIQTRKNQNMDASHLKFEKESLMEISGLTQTSKTNPTRANKLLLEKLNRFMEKGIILSCPKRINDVISLKVR